jgi:hypothetical protein
MLSSDNSIVFDMAFAWTSAYTKLVWCAERRTVLFAFWIAFSAVI